MSDESQTSGEHDAGVAAMAWLVLGVLLVAAGAIGASDRGEPWLPAESVSSGDVVALPAPELSAPDAIHVLGVLVVPPWTRTTDPAPGSSWFYAAEAWHPLPPEGRVVEELEEGQLTVFEFASVEDEEPAAVLRPEVDLASLLSEAVVSIVPDGGEARVCQPWIFGRWQCGPDAWNYVGPVTQTIRSRTESCTWIHPTAEGILRIEFPSLPIRHQLRGRYGFSDVAASRSDAPPVTLEFEVDGEVVATREARSRSGFTNYHVGIVDRFELGAEPEAFTLAVNISADDVAQRHLCIDFALQDVRSGGRSPERRDSRSEEAEREQRAPRPTTPGSRAADATERRAEAVAEELRNSQESEGSGIGPDLQGVGESSTGTPRLIVPEFPGDETMRRPTTLPPNRGIALPRPTVDEDAPSDAERSDPSEGEIQ